MNLAQAAKIVYVIEPEDHQSSGIDGDSINMSQYNHGCWIFQFGELASDSVLKMYSGASDGTKTTAETFRFRACATDLRATGGDTLGSESTSAALTLLNATYEDRFIVVEMDTDELTEDQYFVTPEIDSTASTLFVSCVCILTEPRYVSDVPPAAVA